MSKITPPTEAHKQIHLEVSNLMKVKVAEHNPSATEVLAIMSHMVGQLIALQDQRQWTPQRALEFVAQNIELGNQSVIDQLKNAQTGNA